MGAATCALLGLVFVDVRHLHAAGRRRAVLILGHDDGIYVSVPALIAVLVEES